MQDVQLPSDLRYNKTRNGDFINKNKQIESSSPGHYNSVDILKGYTDTGSADLLDQARKLISTRQMPYSKSLRKHKNTPQKQA